MKKSIILALIATMAFSAIVTGCSTGKSSSSSETKSSSSSEVKTDNSKTDDYSTATAEKATEKATEAPANNVPTEFSNALKQAESYSKTLHMSKQAIFDQLTSEYGGKFAADAAQYAVDNIKADFKKNALESAKSYQKTLNLSKNAIYDQLISEYGGKFTPEEAQYAVDNLE